MNRPADDYARRRDEILALATHALVRRRDRRIRRRRSAIAAAGLLAVGVASWLLASRSAPTVPTRYAEVPAPASTDPPGIEIRLLSDDELIELLESAGYRVELIRTPDAVTVRIEAGAGDRSGS